MFLSTIVNRRNCIVRKKKNYRCSQTFGFGGFNHTNALYAQPVLANLRLFWQKDALVTLFFRLRLRLRLCLWHCSSSLYCKGHVFMQCSEDAQMKRGLGEWVREWVTMSPIEGFLINFDWKILCKCSLIRLLKAIQLFLQAALPKTNNKPISISVCSLLQKLISRGNVRKLGT